MNKRGKLAFITMDVESLYDLNILREKGISGKDCIREGLSSFLDLCNYYNIKATLFINVGVLDSIKDIVKDAIIKGHEIGLHSLKHVSPIFQSDEEFKKDLIEAKSIIEVELGVDVVSYRAPCFGLRDSKLSILKEIGLKCDSSFIDFKEACDVGGFSLYGFDKCKDVIYEREGFYEFALSKAKVLGKEMPISGGAYVRLLPWIISKPLVKKCIKRNDSYVFYIHPYELTEYKKNKEYKKLSFINKLFIKVGRKTYRRKMEKIILYLLKEGYEIIRMRDYIE